MRKIFYILSLILFSQSVLAARGSVSSYGGGGGGGLDGGNSVQFGLSYISIDTKDNPAPDSSGNVSGADSEAKSSFLDVKLGYIFTNLYVGGMYSTYGHDVSGLSTKRSLVGASIGYHNSGFFLDFTYFLMGQLNDKFVTGDQFSSPSGYAFDFGYNAMVMSNFYLGADLSVKNLTYKKYKSAGGSEVATSWIQSELYPMLSLGFVF